VHLILQRVTGAARRLAVDEPKPNAFN